jgi:phosphoribosylformylglycinamidine synthase
LPESPSLFFTGMAGSQLPVVVSHGEGRAEFGTGRALDQVALALRYVDHRGQVTDDYTRSIRTARRVVWPG